MPSSYNIIHNEKQHRFEIHEGDNVAFLNYGFHKNSIAFIHTEVPEHLEGKGLASALTAFAFQYAKEIGKPVMVYCPFVSVYLKRHPELRQQLDKEFHHE